IRDGWPCPVIREKSQSRAQNDSLSLSPAHDCTSLYLHFRALGRPLIWAAYFWPQAFTRQRMRFASIKRGVMVAYKGNISYCFHQNNNASKCEVAHTSFPIRPSKSPADWVLGLVLVPRYRSQEGIHGTETS